MKSQRALLALGRLDSLSTLLPEKHLELNTSMRNEAALSSQIAGTVLRVRQALTEHPVATIPQLARHAGLT